VKACIHRGAQQIGGTCIELEAAGKRLLLDLGLSLDATPGSQEPLPPVRGLATGDDPNLLGILISHPHQDHWGLLPQIPATVPVFIGEAASSVLRAATFFGASGMELCPAGLLRHRQPFALGPFTITPYLNDHSGYDAYSLLIEADGRRLFYTGDFRGHGRKAALFEQLLADPPGDIDVLLMEGTNLHKPGAMPTDALTETALERDLIEVIRHAEGIVLVAFSAQNIDRLVTVYRAALQEDREMVVDLYSAAIAEATGRRSIPKPGFDKLRVFVPQSQRVRIKNAGAFGRTRAVKRCRIYPEELAARKSQLVFLFRQSMIQDLERANCLVDALLIWSLWPGYLQEGGGPLHAFLARHGIPLQIHHTSGHASIADLQGLVDALRPTRVVSIHTFAPERFVELFPASEQRGDSNWWEV